MRDAVILSTASKPVGKAYRGTSGGIKAAELLEVL